MKPPPLTQPEEFPRRIAPMCYGVGNGARTKLFYQERLACDKRGPHDRVCMVCGALIGDCCGNSYQHGEHQPDTWACAGQVTPDGQVISRACCLVRDARLDFVARARLKDALEKRR